MFKHLHGDRIKDKENFNKFDIEHSDFSKMRRSLKFKDEMKKKVSSENIDFLLSNKKFNKMRKSIKYQEEGNEFHQKRRNSEKTLKDRKQKREDDRSIFSSKRLSSQFNNGLLH